jgi:hypothetical protein
MRATATLAILAALSPAAAAQTKPGAQPRKKPAGPTIDARAQDLLKQMSSYLAGMPKLSVHVETSRELVTEDGVKVQFHTSSDVFLQRPDKLRADFKRDSSEASLFYDGKSFSVQRKGAEYYATAPAPPTVDQAIDALREKLDVEAPTADLLFSDPYAVLTKNVQAGAYLGPDNIEGTGCHHLVFRSSEVDWQLWIEDGPKPVPRKLVITSKRIKGEPQLEATLSKWDMAPQLAADLFEFKPPPGATQIGFIPPPKPGKAKNQTQAKTKTNKKKE